MERLALFGSLLFLAACGNPAVDDDDDDDFFTTDQGQGIGPGDQEDTGFVPNNDAPMIIDAEVYCDYTEC